MQRPRTISLGPRLLSIITNSETRVFRRMVWKSSYDGLRPVARLVQVVQKDHLEIKLQDLCKVFRRMVWNSRKEGLRPVTRLVQGAQKEGIELKIKNSTLCLSGFSSAILNPKRVVPQVLVTGCKPVFFLIKSTFMVITLYLQKLWIFKIFVCWHFQVCDWDSQW